MLIWFYFQNLINSKLNTNQRNVSKLHGLIMSCRVFFGFILIIVKGQNKYGNQLIGSADFCYHHRVRDANNKNQESSVTTECETRSNGSPSTNQRSKPSSSNTVFREPNVFDQVGAQNNSSKFFHILFYLIKFMYFFPT